MRGRLIISIDYSVIKAVHIHIIQVICFLQRSYSEKFSVHHVDLYCGVVAVVLHRALWQGY